MSSKNHIYERLNKLESSYIRMTIVIVITSAILLSYLLLFGNIYKDGSQFGLFVMVACANIGLYLDLIDKLFIGE